MIPKIIHYCWFSGEPFDQKTKDCMDTWRKMCPDFEIRECNANNFDINCNDFVREAYNAGKWAFVSDYARLYLLYRYGGIYLDADVELIKGLERFLRYPAFMGEERKGWISAGVIGAEPGNDCIKTFLDYYTDKHFLKPDGSYDQTTNVQIITHNLFESYGFLLNGKKQRLGNLLYVYPTDYFSPKDSITGEIHITDNTYAIHHFNNGWKDSANIASQLMEKKLSTIFPPSFSLLLTEIFSAPKKEGILCFYRKKHHEIQLALQKRIIMRLRKSMLKDLYQ